MSFPTLMDDARARPELFNWNGGVSPAALESWLARNEWMGPCPTDLFDLWRETGGGDVFETETIFGPSSDPSLGDDLVTLNLAMRNRGMQARYLVFHVGLLISATDTETGDYVELAPEDFRVARRFTSLDDWYRTTLRAEYGNRYGLK